MNKIRIKNESKIIKSLIYVEIICLLIKHNLTHIGAFLCEITPFNKFYRIKKSIYLLQYNIYFQSEKSSGYVHLFSLLNHNDEKTKILYRKIFKYLQ